jgi:glycosyl hydrolase family 43
MKTSPASMIFLIVLFAALTIPSCARPQVERAPNITPTIAVVQDSTRTVEPKIEIMKKPLITHLYTADPSAHVFEGKLYIYPSHDLDHDAPPSQNGDQFDMEDYHVFSMENMHSLPVDHGQVLHVDDVPWAEKQMWAPDAAFKNDTYYLYFPAKAHDGNFHIGVATGKSPAGPFTPEPEFIPRSFSIDPCVFIDDDEQAYMYFGGLWGGQLEKWQTDNFDPEGEEPIATQPALGPRVAKLSADMLHFDGLLQKSRSRIRMVSPSLQATMRGGSSRQAGCINMTAYTISRIPPAIRITSPTRRAKPRSDLLSFGDTSSSLFWDGRHTIPSSNFKENGIFSIMMRHFQEASTINAVLRSPSWFTTPTAASRH